MRQVCCRGDLMPDKMNLHCSRRRVRTFAVVIFFVTAILTATVIYNCDVTLSTTPDLVHSLPSDPSHHVTVPMSSLSHLKSDHPTNIVFIKVHKAGSTTIYNMLARYSLSHDLNVALPEQPTNVFNFHCFGRFSTEQVMPLAAGQPYNMLFSHMIYNRTAIDLIMPRDTFYVAIMREPLQRYISGLYFLHYVEPPKVNNASDARFRSHFRYQTVRRKAAGDCRLHNSILCDTGLPLPLQNNETAVKQHLKKLDQELDLMLVMEHFAESLVLFKRRAGLQLKDVLYFKANSRKIPNQHRVFPEDVDEFRVWQKGDYLAYEHFYPKFWEEVRKEGEDFHQEVSHFQDVNERVGNYCSNDSEWDTLVVPQSQWNEEFVFNLCDCAHLTMGEVEMHQLLVRRAEERRKKAGYVERRKTIPQWKPVC